MPIIQGFASALDLLVGRLGRPNKGLGRPVVVVDVVADCHDPPHRGRRHGGCAFTRTAHIHGLAIFFQTYKDITLLG